MPRWQGRSNPVIKVRLAFSGVSSVGDNPMGLPVDGEATSLPGVELLRSLVLRSPGSVCLPGTERSAPGFDSWASVPSVPDRSAGRPEANLRLSSWSDVPCTVKSVLLTWFSSVPSESCPSRPSRGLLAKYVPLSRTVFRVTGVHYTVRHDRNTVRVRCGAAGPHVHSCGVG